MKLAVPFCRQETDYDCGPVALKMVYDFLGKDISKGEIQRQVDSDKSGITWTLGLAVASSNLGFKTEFYTTCLGFNPDNYDLNFYRTLSDGEQETKNKLERLRSKAVNSSVLLREQSLTLEEILEKIGRDCVPIVLLDWSKIKETKEFQGHFVPIVGYDETNVYVHNHGKLNPQDFMPIERKLFEEARKSEGTDEDIIFIYRKI